MNLSGKIYSKTGKGVQALSSKSKQLSADSRKILASIDGKTDAETLMEQFDKLPDEAFMTMLSQLESDGFIRFLKDKNWDIDDDNLGQGAMVVDELSAEDFFALSNDTPAASPEKSAAKSTSKTSKSPEPPPTRPPAPTIDEEKPVASAAPAQEAKEEPASEPSNAEQVRKSEEEIRLALEEAEQKARAEELRQAETRKQEEERKAEARKQEEARQAEEERKKAEAEVIAKAEMAAKLAAERIAREQEEARLKAEAEAREQAELEARLEAERIAREEAERKAREEAERKARREEEARLKAEAEARAKAEKEARKEAERIAKEEAKRKADEEKALREQAKAEARAIAEAEAKVRAEEKAREKAERQAEKEARRAMRGDLDLSKWFAAAKSALIYSPLVLALLVGVLHLVNLPMLSAPMEKFISETIGEPVKVGGVRMTLLPSAGLTLNDVTIGKGADLTIGIMRMSPAVLLQDDTKSLKTLQIQEVTVTGASVARQMAWLKASSKAKNFSIDEVIFEEITFRIPGIELEPFEGKMTKSQTAGIGVLELESDDKRLMLKLTPVGSGYQVAVNAGAWQPPFNTKLEFTEFVAEGFVIDQRVRFERITAELYGGTLTGSAELNWSAQPMVTGEFEMDSVSLPVALSSMGSAASIDGTLKAKGSFSGQAEQIGKLAETVEVDAVFDVQDGKLNDINLASQMISGGSRDNVTRFDKLSGSVKFNSAGYQYQQLRLDSNQFKARGNLDVQANQSISGKIAGELATPSRVMRSNLNVSGSVGSVKLNK